MITTRDRVKTVLGIVGTDKDLLIDELIPLVEDDYLSIRNKPFDVDDNDDIVYPTGSESTAIKMINYQMTSGKAAGVKSERLDDFSITYDTDAGDYPRSVIGGIKTYVSFV